MLAHEEAAQADAMPPGKVVVTGGGPDRWMAEPALAPAGTSRAAAQASAAASQIRMSLAAFIACSFCCCLSPFGGRVAPHKAMPHRVQRNLRSSPPREAWHWCLLSPWAGGSARARRSAQETLSRGLVQLFLLACRW